MTGRLFVCLITLLLAASWMMATPAFAEPDVPPPAASPAAPDAVPTSAATPPGNAGASVTTITRWLPDPKAWAADVFSQTLVTMLSTIAQSLKGMLGGTPGGPLDVLTQTPPGASYGNPAVTQLWGTLRAIANGALALLAVWGGYSVIVGQQTNTPYHEAMELLPRLALGALVANTSLWWGQLGIDLGNALCQAVGTTGLPAWQSVTSSPGQALLDVILTLVYLVLGILLFIQMLMRLALVDVMLVVSPLALVCWILPQTQGWAKRWLFFYVGAVSVQFFQVLALQLGSGVINSLAPGPQQAVGPSMFLAMAVLLLTLRLPSMFIHHSADGMAVLRSTFVAQRMVQSSLPRSGGQSGGNNGSSGGSRATTSRPGSSFSGPSTAGSAPHPIQTTAPSAPSSSSGTSGRAS